ncbi:hypothetical protein JYB87_04285 [Shewanella avicenniae]|uniref:PLD-like domain-containing protein n=1 Tax=Shewanella avicenniae TaxID=2814294 RepID=A0ABX7QV01_9GAMM|nr:hypothetical protein [Shewanella avicenniae]QSX34475.1 hypothetical protein JYB87_04285 [Shewanella avicenniae]
MQYLSEKINAQDTKVFFKPSNIPISELIDVKKSKRMAVFTFKVKKGFAKFVEDALSQCVGEARLVFSYCINRAEDKDKTKENISNFIMRLVEINNKRDECATMEVLIQNLSHIKFMQQDEYIVYGSVNFSISSDAPMSGAFSQKYPSYDELICESNSCGENISDLMWDFMLLKYPDIHPISIPKYPDEKMLDDIVDKIYEGSKKEYSLNDISMPVIINTEQLDLQQVIDSIYEILSIEKDFFQDDPKLEYYITYSTETLNFYLGAAKSKSNSRILDSLFDELDNFVEEKVNEYRNVYIDRDVEIEVRFDTRREVLYEPTEEEISSLSDEVTAEVDSEISQLKDDFLESFDDELKNLLHELIIEECEDS